MADFYAVHRRAIAEGMRSTREGEYFSIPMQVPFGAVTAANGSPMNPSLRIAAFLHKVGGGHLPADKATKAMIDEWQGKYGCVDDWGFPD